MDSVRKSMRGLEISIKEANKYIKELEKKVVGVENYTDMDMYNWFNAIEDLDKMIEKALKLKELEEILIANLSHVSK